MPGIIIKSKIRKIVKELDESGEINNVAEEVEEALEKNVEEILIKAIKRAKHHRRIGKETINRSSRRRKRA